MPNELFNILNGNNARAGQYGRASQARQRPTPQMPRGNDFIKMVQDFGNFKRIMAGKNPEQAVKQLLRTGQMTQREFQQFRQLANNLSGVLK